MKKKRLAVTMAVLAVLLAFAVPSSVKAETKPWEFEATFATGSFKAVKTASKKDASTDWYLTINKTNNGVANTLSSTNRFGCMVKKGKTSASTNHDFGKYVTSYKMTYTIDVAPQNSIQLMGRKDPKSTAGATTLKVSGRFTP